MASKRFRNIVVIQPTLALLDETRKKLKKYKDVYKIIVRTSQEPSEEKGNLFLLTAERVMEYKNLPQIDFFVIDEFYKLSAKRDDERSDVLNNAFYKLLQQTPMPQFYLLGPNIDGISDGFAEKYNAIFYRTNYSLIENKVIDIYSDNKDKFDKPIKYKTFKENKLFELLLNLKDEQTIIYCSSPSRVRELANKFTKFLDNKNIPQIEQLPLVDWIKQNIHEKWNLINFLNHGIGINDGALQKHINSSMIDYFNEGKLKYIFCTTTIIEGVNTSAKNIIFFDPFKGKRKLIDYFDYSNIKGRSGRMMIHYVGRIYNFNAPPKEEEMIVDIPFFHQNPIKDEVLNNLNDSDIKQEVKETDQYKELMVIPQEERELFRMNGVSIKGQKKILEILKNDVQTNQDLVTWNQYPSYEQLEYLITLCWEYFLSESESKKVKSLKQLIFLTFSYGYKKSISDIIKDSFIYNRKLKSNIDKTNEELLNKSVEEVFNIVRHWFQYKIPKWLNVMNELQKYVCKKSGITPGNYTHYANQIENDFITDNLTILSEFGVPVSAIKKIEGNIDENLNEDQVINRVIELSKNNDSLLEYEKDKINKLL